MTHQTGKLASWRLGMSEIGFEVGHRSGKMHQATNALPHLSTIRMGNSPPEEDLPVFKMPDVQANG